MEYSAFEIKNFKGIEHIKVDLESVPSGSIYTLVGLNESGKTTVLEAMGFFNRDEIHPGHLYDASVEDDVHDLIPMKKKANFNESISVEATLLLDIKDKRAISKFAREKVHFKIKPETISDHVEIRTELKFENSIYQSKQNYWTLELDGTTKQGHVVRKLIDYDKGKWKEVIGFIRERIPSILYFPTFLFEFPSKIYLQKEEDENPVNTYYRSIIQDILDSLKDDLDVEKHIVSRALDGSYNNRRSLDTVLNKMGNVITKTVFERWNEVFDRKIPRKDIVVSCDVEEVSVAGNLQNKVFLQFELKDGDAVYLITERSLGFRWFFCFLLFTQFRQHRKSQPNTLFLFDEPASNLHSKAQTQLMQSFARITEETGTIVYSTHSHYMVNPQWLENTYIVRNQGLRYEDNEGEYEFSSQDTDIKLEKYRQFVGENPEKFTFFQPVLDTLDYVPSNLEFIPNAVFLEGKNDYYLVKYFSTIQLQGVEQIGLIPGIGASGLDTVIALYLGWGRDFIILLDDDGEGRKARDRYRREWFLREDQVFTLGDIDKSWSGLSLEKIFDAADISQLKSDFYSTSTRPLSKKQIVKAIQELLLRREKGEFESATEANFRKLIDFCSAALNGTS